MKNFLLLLFIALAFATFDSQAATCPKISELSTSLYKAISQEAPKINLRKQIKIAVIDTGVDYNNRELRSALWMPSGRINAFNFGEDLVKGNHMPQDDHGHGTHIAGIIVGLFPQAKIYSLKYYNPKATGVENLKSFTKSIELAIKAKVDIINISGGGPEYASTEHELIKEAKKKNILIVSAGGNEGYELNAKNTYYPAQYNEENILSVANLNAEGFRHRSSNYGKEIQVGALGTLYSYDIEKDSCKTKLIGTSQSTAVVSALAGIIKAENPKLTASEIKEIIIANAVETPGKERHVSFSKRTLPPGRKLATKEAKTLTENLINFFK